MKSFAEFQEQADEFIFIKGESFNVLSRELTYSEWNVWKILGKVLKRPQRMKNKQRIVFQEYYSASKKQSRSSLFTLPRFSYPRSGFVSDAHRMVSLVRGLPQN